MRFGDLRPGDQLTYKTGVGYYVFDISYVFSEGENIKCCYDAREFYPASGRLVPYGRGVVAWTKTDHILSYRVTRPNLVFESELPNR